MTESNSPLLKNIDPQSASFLKTVIDAVQRDDLQSALDEIYRIAENEIPDEYSESYLTIAINICAAIESADDWIFFKKLWAQLLLDKNRTDEARIEINELAGLLPNDDDVIALQSSLGSQPAIHMPLNNEGHLGIENPDLTPSYLNVTKGSPIMGNSIDKRFYELFAKIKSCASVKALSSHIANNFKELPPNRKQWLLKYNNWGNISHLNATNEHAHNSWCARAESLYNHADDIIWFYERLEDYRSRYALLAFCRNWVMFDDMLGRVGKMRDDIYKEYLDFDVLKFGKDEVYADCGGFIGDSLADYLNEVGVDSHKKIYVYEIDPQNCDAINRNIKQWEKAKQIKKNSVELRRKGVGLNGKLRFTPAADGQDRSGHSLGAAGTLEVDVAALDDDIAEPLTYIKMDIEGAEYAALLGAKRHMAEEYPKLAICVYHKPHDIWELPRLIDAIAPKYKFSMRFCGFPLATIGMYLLAVKDDEDN